MSTIVPTYKNENVIVVVQSIDETREMIDYIGKLQEPNCYQLFVSDEINGKEVLFYTNMSRTNKENIDELNKLKTLMKEVI